jgi:hypothetical protein
VLGYLTNNPQRYSLFVSSDEQSTSESDDDDIGSEGGGKGGTAHVLTSHFHAVDGGVDKRAASRIRENLVLVPHKVCSCSLLLFFFFYFPFYEMFFVYLFVYL